MQLYPLLKDRSSINILKALNDNEFGSDGKHTMLHYELKQKLTIREGQFTIALLESSGLIATDKGNNGLVLSITLKGKEFLEAFDKLVEITSGKKTASRAYQVQYSLTGLEKKILLVCSKINAESGKPVDLKTLTQEVYPYTEPNARKSSLSKSAKKLEDLNLIRKIKENNRVFFDVTESGEKALKDQFMENQIINNIGQL